MTKDLTERLKDGENLAGRLLACAAYREMILVFPWPALCALLTEAASRIERLEGEVQKFMGLYDAARGDVVTAEQALSASQQEAERLRGLLARARLSVPQAYKSLHAEIATALRSAEA